MKRLLLILLAMPVASRLAADNDFCEARNTSFNAGEVITLHVFYNALGIYVDAGTAEYTVTQEKMSGKPVYHILGTGTTNSKYDWIFKVRDRYESYIDTATLRPYKFVRNVSEGSYKKYENVTFNHNANTALTTTGIYKVPPCIQDVVSAVYYARNVNFDKYKVGDKIPFSMFLDNEVYNMYIRYMGKETVKTRYGKFKAVKFKPLLVKGEMFSGGEKMTLWVSDDRNRIPLRIESPLVVGSVKADMMSYKNLRYPLSSFISF